MEYNHLTYDEMIDWAEKEVLRAFNKGESLHESVAGIVNSCALWGVRNIELRQNEKRRIKTKKG